MLKRILVVVLVSLAVALPATADTRAGFANLVTIQSWGFTPVGAGQVQITLSWTKAKADLIMILVCGIAEPTIFGIAGGGLDRVAMINAGVESDVPCEVGVISNRNTSAYRIHFQHAISQPSQGRGRMPLALSVHEAQEGSMLADDVARGLEEVRQLLKARDSAGREQVEP